jgi:Na+-transporting methylmalonyl-CoA/oxaloacetate decarboxylase gamma subunit
MSITAMGVVFLVLIICSYAFYLLAVIIRRSGKRKSIKATKQETALNPDEIPGDIMAAISMTLFQLSNDAHDIENTVLTIAQTRRNYSPWSSKIYNMRHLPK